VGVSQPLIFTGKQIVSQAGSGSSQLLGRLPSGALGILQRKYSRKRCYPSDFETFASNTWVIGFAPNRRRWKGEGNHPDTTPPTVTVQKPVFLPSRNTPKLRATWLGHACYYVEFPGGLRVLFDPVFEDRCSPFSWLGPKRYTEVPCKISDIPFIDAVVISHNHYDHLSYHTVKEIANAHPTCHFFAPLGNRPWFSESGIQNMTELDWWDERELTLSSSHPKLVDVKKPEESSSQPSSITARIGCLPCQHTSNRGLTDRAKTLWGSWCIESGGKTVYFAGYASIYR
jgi:hypothetical protein